MAKEPRVESPLYWAQLSPPVKQASCVWLQSKRGERCDSQDKGWLSRAKWLIPSSQTHLLSLLRTFLWMGVGTL